jgi:uncharacterized protein YkwD
VIFGRRSAVFLGGLAALALAMLWLTTVTGAAPAPQAAAPAATTPANARYFPVIMVQRPTPTSTPLPVTPPASGDWRAVLSYYRASAHLPNVGENSGWSAGAANHARYMAENDVLASSEGTATPFYTAAGATEAANSNLMLSGDVSTTDQQALDFWMAKPFHALGLLDPALLTTGFGSYREATPVSPFDPFSMGAAVDVRQGLGAIPGTVQFPLKWPEHNATVYLTSYDGNEQPDPLTSCPGYSVPSGLPLILQIGPGGTAINVTASSFLQGSTPLPNCVFGPSNYTNPIGDLQTLGRQILAESDAVILIPQQPLMAGLDYTASITVNGQVITWTFHVAAP